MSGEKSFAPTEKRKRDAAQKGDVLRSREVATAIAVLAGAVWLKLAGPWMLDALADVATSGRVAATTVSNTPVRPEVSDGVLDVSVLDELTALGMGDAFEREFIEQCLNDADGCIGAMAHAMERGDGEHLREHAHALKGVASNLGLVQVATAGGELMRMPDWQLKAEWTPRAGALGNALRQGRKALDARAVALRQSGGDECTPS